MTVIYAHRGLLNGPDPQLENTNENVLLCGYAGVVGIEFDVRLYNKHLLCSHNEIKPSTEYSTFRAMCKMCKKFDIRMNIEIKEKGIESLVYQTVKELRLVEVEFTSFIPEVVHGLIGKNFRVGALCYNEKELNEFMYYDFVSMNKDYFEGRDGKNKFYAMKERYPVYVWTVNDEKEIKKFTKWGASIIMTDYAEKYK